MPTQPELRVINIGQHANDGTGDTLRAAAEKVNANFDDVYSALGINGGSATFVNSINLVPDSGYGIHVNRSSGNVTVSYNAPKFETVKVAGNDDIVANNIHGILNVAAGDLITLDTNAGTDTLTITAIDPRTQPGGGTDWNAVQGNVGYIANKPTLFSGNYSDLNGKPTIPAAQVNSDWNASSGIAQILNKPSVSTFQADWLNGDSGTLGYIKNKPTIATDVSDLTDLNKRLIVDAAHYTTFTDVNAGLTSTIYTATASTFAGLKAVIFVGIPDGSGGAHIESTEITVIASHPASGTPVVEKLTYNGMHTGVGLFCTYDASWDGVANRVIITIHNGSSQTVSAKVSAVEYA